MTDGELAGARASVRMLWESIGQSADCMVRPAAQELERCAAVCGTLRARLPAGDRALVLVGQLEALAGDPDPSWSTVIAVAATLGDLDAALRPQET